MQSIGGCSSSSGIFAQSTAANKMPNNAASTQKPPQAEHHHQQHHLSSVSSSLVRPSTSSGSLSSATTTPSSDVTSNSSRDADSPPMSAASMRLDCARSGRRTISSDSDDDDYPLCSMDDDDDDDDNENANDQRYTEYGQRYQHRFNGSLAAAYTSDELPVFRCQSMSPTSRSISPIDHRDDTLFNFSMSPCGSVSGEMAAGSEMESEAAYDGGGDGDGFGAFDRISLADIHARMVSDRDGDVVDDDDFTDDDGGGNSNAPASSMCATPVGKRLKLETIVEGVFLDTPPRRKAQHGAWRVATQSIDQFVEDQYRRRYEAIAAAAAATTDEAPQRMQLDDDGEEEMTEAAATSTAAVVTDGQEATNDELTLDRMRNSFQKKLHMC